MNERELMDSLNKALEQVVSLKKEREFRGTGLHADDCRIATEIAQSLFKLGRYRKLLTDSIESMNKGIEKSKMTLSIIDDCHNELIGEMDILNFRNL